MRGFTLVEILIVITIFTVLAGLGLFMTMDSYRGFASRSELGTVVSLLTAARSASMANINQTSWGVCYSAPNYIVFQGTTCTAGATSRIVPTGGGVTIAGLYAPGVVFTQLSGTTTATTTTITQNGRVSTISINYEGTITW